MRRFGFAFSAACSLLIVTAVRAAEPQELTLSDPATLIDSVSPEILTKLVTEIGGQKVQTSDADGRKIVTFSDGDTSYNLGIAACDVRPGKCVALIELVVVTTGTTEVPLEALNKYNGDSLFLVAFKLEANKIGFGRVVMVDGGVTKKNLAINLISFAGALDDGVKGLRAQLAPSAQLTRPSSSAPPVAMAPAPFVAVPADAKQIGTIMDAMLTQYKATIAKGRTH